MGLECGQVFSSCSWRFSLFSPCLSNLPNDFLSCGLLHGGRHQLVGRKQDSWCAEIRKLSFLTFGVEQHVLARLVDIPVEREVLAVDLLHSVIPDEHGSRKEAAVHVVQSDAVKACFRTLDRSRNIVCSCRNFQLEVVIHLAHSAAPDHKGSNVVEILLVTGRRRVPDSNYGRFFWATYDPYRAQGVGSSCPVVPANVVPEIVTAVPLDEASLKRDLWLAVNLTCCLQERT